MAAVEIAITRLKLDSERAEIIRRWERKKFELRREIFSGTVKSQRQLGVLQGRAIALAQALSKAERRLLGTELSNRYDLCTILLEQQESDRLDESCNKKVDPAAIVRTFRHSPSKLTGRNPYDRHFKAPAHLYREKE